MKTIIGTGLALTLVVTLIISAVYVHAQQRGDSVRGETPVDVLNMERPIEMHDSVWIGELTTLEVRDLIKAGKTTALILGGGMEENGPYLVLDKHNLVSRTTGESVARRLG